jgi:hypothetical protein
MHDYTDTVDLVDVLRWLEQEADMADYLADDGDDSII